MSTGTPVVDALSLTPNEYHTISRIGMMKNSAYQSIPGMARANDGNRNRRPVRAAVSVSEVAVAIRVT